MMKSIAFLSHKGGVGKTSIALNVGVALAQQGYRICLLDNDFFGPSLSTFIDPSVKWLNEYLTQEIPPKDILQDVSSHWGLKGKLFLGFADPSAKSVQSIIRIDQKSSIRMLQKLIKLKKILKNPPFSIDYLLVDSSPGTGFTTVNAMLLTDINLFIVKISNSDINGTSEMVLGLNKQLKNKIKILANQVPASMIDTEAKKKELNDLISPIFTTKAGGSDTEFIGIIPSDPDLLTLEYAAALKTLHGENESRLIHVIENPDNVFSKMILHYLPKIIDEAE